MTENTSCSVCPYLVESAHGAVDLDVERGHHDDGDDGVQEQQCQVGIHLKKNTKVTMTFFITPGLSRTFYPWNTMGMHDGRVLFS